MSLIKDFENKTDEQIIDMLSSASGNKNEVAKACGFHTSAPPRFYHRIALAISRTGFVLTTRRLFREYSLEDALAAINQATSWTEACNSLNISVCTANFRRLQGIAADNNISTGHYGSKRVKSVVQWTPETVFVENCTISRARLRPVLIRIGYYTGRCAICDLPDEWLGQPLTLDIDHINGDHKDNRKENLRWLCPNCHALTPTFRRGCTTNVLTGV